MKKSLGVVAAAVLVASTGAFSAQPQSDQAAKQEKKVCKTQKMTGSLTRVQRTCLTQAEWDRLAEGTRRNIDTIDRDANQREALRKGDFNGAGAMAGGF